MAQISLYSDEELEGTSADPNPGSSPLGGVAAFAKAKKCATRLKGLFSALLPDAEQEKQLAPKGESNNSVYHLRITTLTSTVAEDVVGIASFGARRNNAFAALDNINVPTLAPPATQRSGGGR